MSKRWLSGILCSIMFVAVVPLMTGVAYADAVTAGQEDCTQQQLDSLHAKAGVMDNGTCVATVCVNGYELVDKVCVAKGSGCDSGLLNTVHATTGYMQDDVCIPTECMNGYNLIEDNGKKLCKFMGEGCSQVALTAVYATAGYMSDERCVPTVCMSGYELEEGRCVRRGNSGSGNQGGGAVVTADCGKNLFNPQLLIEAGLTSYNTSTYTFTGRFTRDYSTSTKANTGEFTGNHYMSNYSYGLVPNTTYELVYTIKCDTDSNSVNSKDMIIGLKTKSGNTVDEVAPTVDACSNGVATATATAGGGGVSVTGVYVGRAAGTSADFNGELNISNVMLVLNSENTNSMIPYGPCIKVSTKASTATRAAGVESRLSNLRDMIDHLISRTQASAIDINSLDSEKQTRPADESTDSCQTGDSCLLIKDASGTNHWYRIETCNADLFLNNVGSYEAITINSQSYQAVNGCTNAQTSVLGCNEGEIVQAYHNGIVFIEQIGLNIAENAGTVVSLPSNVTGESGYTRRHLCRVAGYRIKNGDGTLQARHNVDTNLWIVDDTTSGDAGNCYRYMMGASNILAYYSSIANTCTAPVSGANMCLYNYWLGSVVQHAPESGDDGFIAALGSSYTDDICSGNPDTVDSGWCTTANELTDHGSWNYNTWIAKLPTVTLSGTGNPNVPEIYGRAYCTDLDGTSLTQYSMLNPNEIGTVDPDGVLDSGGEHAGTCVCTVTGYRNAGAATITPVSGTNTTNNTNYTKYLFAGTVQAKCQYDCQKMCADAFTEHANNNLMRYFADSCSVN